MSCERNGRRVWQMAGAAVGVAAAGNRFVNLAGTALASRLGDRAGQAAGRVLGAVDRRGVVAQIVQQRAVKGAVAGAVVGAIADRAAGSEAPARLQQAWQQRRQAGSPTLRQLAQAAVLTTGLHKVSGGLGSLLGRSSRQGSAGQARGEKPVDFFGVRLQGLKVPHEVPLWRSKLTAALNKADLLGTKLGGQVRSSDGVLFETDGVAWHRGTTVLDTPSGRRTITHLQSLTLPAAHYYFDRQLTNKQAVDIAGGGFSPDRLRGYVGQVSALESLLPAWGGLKQALIKAELLFAPRPGRSPQK